MKPGEANASAVLTESSVMEARRAFAMGATQMDMVRALGVDKNTLCRAIKGHTWSHLPLVPRASDEERFWAKVGSANENGCRLWRGGAIAGGYGHLRYGKRTVLAHRLSWELTSGPIPVGMLVCHRCDVPACCEPGHLFLGDHKANADDMCAKGRHGRTGPRGDAHPMAKLTAETVASIRARVSAGETRMSIANELGVSRSTIGRAVSGALWRNE